MNRKNFLTMKTEVENICTVFGSKFEGVLDAVEAEFDSNEFLILKDENLLSSRKINKQYIIVFNKKGLLSFLEENRSKYNNKIWMHSIDYRYTSFTFERCIKYSDVLNQFLIENNYNRFYEGESFKGFV